MNEPYTVILGYAIFSRLNYGLMDKNGVIKNLNQTFYTPIGFNVVDIEGLETAAGYKLTLERIDCDIVKKTNFRWSKG